MQRRRGLRIAAAACVVSVFVGSATALDAQMVDSAIHLVAFIPETKTLRPGEAAVSQIVLRNGGSDPRVVWLGYSVADPDGRWFDIAPDRVVLKAGEVSAQPKQWSVPVRPTPVSGNYRVIMAVWSAPPGSEGARRLLKADRRDAFRVQAEGAALVDEPKGIWRATEHSLGRGRMRAERVLVSGAGYKLRLSEGSCDGAELRTVDRYSYGEYSARIRAPAAPGSLSAFFLYSGVRGENDEIDIEIYNDGSRLATITSWVAGEKKRKRDVRLSFDPSAGFHDYSILWWEKELVVSADGVQLARWTGGYARAPMHVLASAWYPSWLECEPLVSDRELLVEWIHLSPQDSARKD